VRAARWSFRPKVTDKLNISQQFFAYNSHHYDYDILTLEPMSVGFMAIVERKIIRLYLMVEFWLNFEVKSGQ
jgi:hypothetical protein